MKNLILKVVAYRFLCTHAVRTELLFGDVTISLPYSLVGYVIHWWGMYISSFPGKLVSYVFVRFPFFCILTNSKKKNGIGGGGDDDDDDDDDRE